jgi:hypothetical protein
MAGVLSPFAATYVHTVNLVSPMTTSQVNDTIDVHDCAILFSRQSLLGNTTYWVLGLYRGRAGKGELTMYDTKPTPEQEHDFMVQANFLLGDAFKKQNVDLPTAPTIITAFRWEQEHDSCILTILAAIEVMSGLQISAHPTSVGSFREALDTTLTRDWEACRGDLYWLGVLFARRCRALVLSLAERTATPGPVNNILPSKAPASIVSFIERYG